MKIINIVLVLTALILLTPSAGFSGIIFEDNFANDGGWNANCGGTISQANAPSKWSGYRCQTNSTLSIASGAGQSGTPALKIGYEKTAVPGAMSLFKHLTGNQNTGYNELYVRYQFKFDNDWKSGTNGTDMQYWKWIRLWQGIPPTDQSQWSEINNSNTRYLISILNGNAWSGNPCIVSMWGDNAAGHSASGPRYKSWFNKQDPVGTTDGCLGSIPSLQIQKPGDPYPGYFTTYPSGSQTWHTIEFHFKLSTSQSGNGVFEVWLDGTKQSLPMPYGTAQGGATMSYFNTMVYKGGMNLLTVFDNMNMWTAGWTSTKYIYVDNVVVGNTYISPNYVVSGGGGSPDTISPGSPFLY